MIAQVLNSNTSFWSSFRYSFVFSCCLFLTTVNGQSDRSNLANTSLKEIKGTAKNALRLGDTYTALFYYQEWVDRQPENLKITYQVAELYRVTRNYKAAEEWYLKLTTIAEDEYPLSLFHLANVQLSLQKYAEAKKHLLKFKKVAKKVKDPKFRKLLKTRLLSCDYAINLKDSINTAVVEHLDTSINKPHVEFSPILLDSETLIYGSLKEDGVNYYKQEVHDSMKIPLRKFYVAKKKDRKWKATGELVGPFNKENMHVGNGALSANGQRMYFTLCQKNWQNKVICQLYYADKNSSGWNEPIKMNDLINLSNYTATQPSVGRESRKNREVLYFVSDRPGGKGGLDIWYTEYDKRKKVFKAPRNAGSKINTVGTECTPYYDLPTHQLYFSSDGKIGIGGLDVYQVEGEKSRWQQAKHLKESINSSADDIDFEVDKENRGGFVVSNRKGGVALLNETCCDDIYEVKFTKYININLSGLVLDSGNCLTDYLINVYIKNKEEGQANYLAQQIKAADCDFSMNLEQGHEYLVEITKDGYLNKNTTINTEKIVESTNLTLKSNLIKAPTEAIVLEGILYEFNSPKLTPNAKMVIDTGLYQLLIDNPSIVIQISSHTDNKGTNNYNLKLSRKRAESVVRYLRLKGVNEKRLQFEGYGETNPIAANQHPDGSDNPAGRKLNRRTDFKIVGKVNAEDIEEDRGKSKRKKKNVF